eukprot:514549-Hanusia_phi.AAC.1
METEMFMTTMMITKTTNLSLMTLCRHGMHMYTTISSAPRCRILALKIVGTSHNPASRFHRPWFRVFSNNLLLYDHRTSPDFAEQRIAEGTLITNLEVASTASLLVEEDFRVELIDSVGMVDKFVLSLHLHSAFVHGAQLLEFSKDQLDVACQSQRIPQGFKLQLVMGASERRRELSTVQGRDIFVKEPLPSQLIPSSPDHKEVPNHETHVPSSAYQAKTPADLGFEAPQPPPGHV